jgi:hypothetical protein
LEKLFEKQNRKCALSNMKIRLSRNTCHKYSTYEEQTASLDRINNNQGYIESNVQWVHKHINRMKWQHDIENFVNLCKKVVEHAA